MLQTTVAACEAETKRAASAVTSAIDEDGEVLGGIADEEAGKMTTRRRATKRLRPRKLNRTA